MRTVLVAAILLAVACSSAEPQRDYSQLPPEEQNVQRQRLLSSAAEDWQREHGTLLPRCTKAGIWVDARGDVRFDAMGHARVDGLFAELCEEYLSPEQQNCVSDFALREHIECCLRGTPLESPDAFDGTCEAIE